MKRFWHLAVLAAFFGLSAVVSEAAAGPQAFSFSKDDRVLIVAPHPDDETLGAGGLIQSALGAGSAVRVVYLTQGESNEISALFYRKKPLLLRSDFIKNGRIRKEEAAAAMSVLGLGRDNLVFLGYPDFGTLKIWQKHWDGAKPFRSFVTRIKKVPYKDDFSYGQSYLGDNIVRDFEKVLSAFSPTHVFVTAPFDLHPDHQAAYLCVNAALFNLGETLKPLPAVHLYVVHAHRWPAPKRYSPGTTLPPPEPAAWKGVSWVSVPLDAGQVEKKKAAILKYASQVAYSKNFLLSFARSNELYADYPFKRLVPEPQALSEETLSGREVTVGDVRYALDRRDLFVDIPLSVPLDEIGTLRSYVFGYRKGFPFSKMPKLSFGLFGTKLFVRNGLLDFYDPGITYKLEKKRVLIKVPLRLLKNPDHLFVSTRTAKEELSLDFGSWRILEIAG